MLVLLEIKNLNVSSSQEKFEMLVQRERKYRNVSSTLQNESNC